MTNNSKIPILHYSVSESNIECTKGLIQCGYCSINDLDNYGRTALFICAAEYCETNMEIARYLLDSGIDINIQANSRWYNRTCLHTACYYGNREMIKLMLEYNANYELEDLNGKVGWQIAEEMQHYECVELLLSEIENQGETNPDLEKELQDAVFNNDYEITKSCLEKLGKKARYVLNSTQSGTQTYLYRACRNGNAKMVQLLFDHGAIARPHYYTRYSPLYVACHTGNIEIAKLILNKYPSLINVQTIENFLPIHAACSQGHIDLVKILIEYKYPNGILNLYDVVKQDASNNQSDSLKYLFAFDLNSVDCNEQTILYTSISSNSSSKYELCKYLLELKLKSLNNKELKELDRKKQVDFKLRKFLLTYTQQKLNDQQQQQSNVVSVNSYAFYEQLKKFLNSKSEFIESNVNNSSNIDSKQLSVVYHNQQDDDEFIATSEGDNGSSEQIDNYFNPFNVNTYSKFGCTCLHEAIRNQNMNIVKLLVNKHNADVNLPIYDSTSVLDQTNISQRKQISNCLCETLKHKNVDMYLYLLKNKNVNEDTVKYTIKYCLSIVQEPCDPSEKEYVHFLLNIFSYLLTLFRLAVDKEYKIQIKSKQCDYEGLILNLNSFEPSLRFFYESWLLNISMYYRSKQQSLHAINDPIELNRLHNTIITRIDLSYNVLENIPVCLFQIENLKVLKLNNNNIKELPTRKTIFDNVNRIDSTSDTNCYTCNLLEELDLSVNCLVEIPSQIFYLKCLKYLNVSTNKLQSLPCDLWRCSSLCELNASFNKLNNLPLRPTITINKQQSLTNSSTSSQISTSTSSSTITSSSQRGKAHSINDQPQTSSVQTQLSHNNFVEKPVRKVNFWQIHCLNQNDLNEDDDADEQQAGNASNINNTSITNLNPSISNLTDLNLSNNCFTKVPSCLSCLAPKLLKLNLSFNSIESMGSISDYPTTIKFLDLSNNMIKEQIRLINPDMLNYFLNESSTATNKQPALNNDIDKSNIIDFCYLNLLNHETMSADQRLAAVNSSKKRQQQKRRARSHSRNAAASRLIGTNASRNPFELFLLNSNYKNTNVTTVNVDYKDEEKMFNSHNLQCFLDKLCVHKKHIRLDNLKTLNLSQNKINKVKLIFNLTVVNNEALLKSTNQNDKHQRQRHNSYVDDKQISPGHKQNLKSSQSYVSSENSDEDSETETKVAVNKAKQKSASKFPFVKEKENATRKYSTDDNITKILFPNLTHLDISFNQLKRLPGSLYLLDHLSYLNASNNPNLRKISPKIGLLSKLWNLDLKGCTTLEDPILDAMINKQRSRTSDVLGFLKSILEHSKPYTRIKLMLVGVQAIGKTSLIHKLREETTGSSSRNRNSGQTWSDRMSHNSTSSATSNISTVGIDINEWIFEKPKSRSSQSQQNNNSFISLTTPSQKTFGPITFRTWDFAGQREYIAIHQYFISKRALYLVCWKLTEEEKGINEIHSWLINIQTRAPGSPCIIVGTHQDQLAKLKNYKEISNFLQRIIFERFIKLNNETENCQYPPIWASIEVSCKTGYNIKQLANLVYDVACQMKAPGVKDQLILEQKVPVTYLVLEDCLTYISTKLKSLTKQPILNTNDYLKEVKDAIKFYTSKHANSSSGLITGSEEEICFRDDAEILQATQFLHDNGVIIHYNDSGLRDNFFLDPQWLCDILATVVTIREVNPFASKGIMLISDLLVLFKGSHFDPKDLTGFIVNLLGKFELALTWDNKHLLIPSLLPSETMLKFCTTQRISISIINRESWLCQSISELAITSGERKQSGGSNTINLKRCKSDETLNSDSVKSDSNLPQSQSTFSNLNNCSSDSKKLPLLYECKPVMTNSVDLTEQQSNSIRRLYCLSFIPTGFFSRLITRILSDNILKTCLLDLLKLELCFDRNSLSESELKEFLNPLLDYVSKEAEWKCWQTGIELKYLDYTLIRVKELLFDPLMQMNNGMAGEANNELFLDNQILYRDCENEYKLKNSKMASFVELYASFRDYQVNQINENKCLMKILCNKRVTVKIFALIIEIMDSLLEDWYPDLGTRFMQDSKGDYLVTRLAPCFLCTQMAKQRMKAKLSKNQVRDTQKEGTKINEESIGSPLITADSNLDTTAWNFVSIDERFKIATVLEDTISLMDEPIKDNIEQNLERSSKNEDITNRMSTKLSEFMNIDWLFCFMTDDVCYSVLKNVNLNCPKHGLQLADNIAPDLAFEDIENDLKIPKQCLKIEKLLGRGSFGSVYSGIFQSNKYDRLKIAIKALESVDSANDNKVTDKKIDSETSEKDDDFWSYRKPVRLAAKAYSVARQEIAILFSLKHENIVSIIGLSMRPLAIILELATNGNLKEILADYRRNLCYLQFTIIQQVSIQISSALSYLHSNLIIYRDLKSENVLVWKFPKPNKISSENSGNSVYVKLADYSISRSVLPTGTKGFAGTEGYISPEIIRFNGEETYTEKVDCFSFGMLLYELISLKHPFEGQEQIKDIVLHGGRPLIKTHESLYPTLMLDLMCLCWSDNPSERPSATDILKYSKSYEFSHLLDVCVLEDYQNPPLIVQHTHKDYIYDSIYDIEDEVELMDIWIVKNCIDDNESKFEILTYENFHNFTSRKQLNVCSERIDAICLYKKQIWCIDSMKCIYVFCAKTYVKLNQYLLSINLKSEILSMFSLENIDKIVLVTKTGSIVIVNAVFHSLSDDLNFNLFETNIGSISAAVTIQIRHEKNYEIWLAGESAQLHVFNLNTMKLVGIYNHFSNITKNNNSFVTNSYKGQSNSIATKSSFILQPDDSIILLKSDGLFMWSYIYPSSFIFLWNHVSKSIMSSYDCKKLLNDLNSTELSSKEFRIIDICFMNNQLYCCTNTGIVFTLKRLTLTPLAIFKSHVQRAYQLCSTTFESTSVSASQQFAEQSRIFQQQKYFESLSSFIPKPLPINQIGKIKQKSILITFGRALSPLHEDIFLSSTESYKNCLNELKNYANCLFVCAWNCNEDM